VTVRTTYTTDELLAEHAYERPLVVDGVACHGGFVGDAYVSPRTRWRAPALDAILEPITARVPPHFPSVAQTTLLVRHDVRLPLVRILTLIAMVEGYGGEILRLLPIPPLEQRVRGPVAGTALAHLATLFEAHARDEAGHEHMWKLARDVALDHPAIPDMASGMAPPGGTRLLPEIPADLEAVILRMVGVLVIEVFAVGAFRWASAVLGDASLFPRHADARALVGYIQQDEAPHVGYLATALAELRCRELVGVDGGTVSGRDVIDRVRDMLVAFQTGPRHQANVQFRTQVTERAVAEHPKRDALLAEFRALAS
jgi:hypothetical protein